MARTRLLQLIPNLGVGGAERMVANLVSSLDRARYEVVVISLFDAGGSSIERDLDSSGVEVIHLGKRLGFDARMFSRIAAAISKFHPDIVHTHRSVLQYAMPALRGRLRGRVAHTLHNVAEQEAARAGRMAQWVAFRTGVAPIAIGTMVADSITRVYGLSPRAIIPHGIPVQQFGTPVESRSAWRKRLDISEEAVLFTSVARLTPQKAPEVLLEAFETIRRSGYELVLAGDGPLRASLEAQTVRRHATSPVRFLGSRPDIPDLLAASDVFVLASRWEGNPLSILEAMAAGRPVIATAVGGVPEFVRHRETGLLVPPGDGKALAEAMLELGQDPVLRQRLGANGACVASRLFDVTRMAAAYDRLYQELAAGKG
jgi:glycosyltransferase involved in cell wall biosynthesis